MPGKPMKEYVTLPEEWRDEPGKITAWIEQSLQWAGGNAGEGACQETDREEEEQRHVAAKPETMKTIYTGKLP